MNKIRTTLLLIPAVLFFITAGQTVCATETTSDHLWQYETDENTVTLTSYEGTSSEVDVPDTIEGKKVTKLAKNCFDGNYSIRYVTIPATVKTVEAYTFHDCGNLKRVTFSGMNTHVDNDFARLCGDNVKVFCYLYSATYYDIALDYPMEYLGIHITLDKTNVSADVGETCILHATLNQSTATPVFTWDSSNPAAATVTSDGKVTAGSPGAAVITASATIDGETFISEPCTINVETPFLSTTAYTAYRGDTFTLTVYNIKASKITWSSSDNRIATVKKGRVTIKKKGRVTIRAKYGKTTLSCKVTAINPSFQTTNVRITKGFSFRQQINGGKGKKITWSTSNAGIATVNQKGKITGKNLGSCTIMAKVAGIKIKCRISVLPNTYTAASKAKLSQYDHGTIHYQLQKAYFKGNKLVIKVKFFNRTGNTYKRLSFMSFKLVSGNKTYFSKTKNNPHFTLKSNSAKTLTFSFNTKNLQKKVDLSTASWSCNAGLLYTH